MKAISAVIATIMLLMVTVSLVGVFYVFSSTMATTTTASGGEQASQLTSQLSACMKIDNIFDNQITVRNCGKGIIENKSLIVTMDGIKLEANTLTINEGDSGTVNITGLWQIAPGKRNLKISNSATFALALVEVKPNPDGLVGSWGFDEGSGNKAYDDSGSKNIGTLLPLGSEPQWVSGKFSKGLQFDGVNEYVNVLDSASLDITSALIIEAWIKQASDIWNYRKPVIISNPGAALTNYQINVTMNTASLIAASRMRSDCGDIRFRDSDGATNLYYWIESGCNSASTMIWIKVPSVPSGSKTVYVNYGNLLLTSASNGVNTFDFFDDFSGTAGTPPDAAKWISKSPYVTLQTKDGRSVAWINDTENNATLKLHSISKFNPNTYIFETMMKGFGSSSDFDSSFGFSGLFTNLPAPGEEAQFNYSIYCSGCGDYVANGTETLVSDWRRLIGQYVSGNMKTSYDGQLLSSSQTHTYTSNNVSFNMNNINEPALAIDWVFLRKYASINPTTSIGTEETVSGIVAKKGTAYGIFAGITSVVGMINGNNINASTFPNWNHIVLTYDGSFQRLYINGNLSKSQSLTGAIGANSENLIIGNLFNGTIDELRIWKKAFTPNEVAAMKQLI